MVEAGARARTGASSNGIGTGLARRVESLANEVRNDANVHGAPMLEIPLVICNKRLLLPAIKSILEYNGRVAALAQVDSALGETSIRSFASRQLSSALANSTAEFTSVGGIGALVVLNVAAASGCGADVVFLFGALQIPHEI